MPSVTAMLEPPAPALRHPADRPTDRSAANEPFALTLGREEARAGAGPAPDGASSGEPRQAVDGLATATACCTTNDGSDPADAQIASAGGALVHDGAVATAPSPASAEHVAATVESLLASLVVTQPVASDELAASAAPHPERTVAAPVATIGGPAPGPDPAVSPPEHTAGTSAAALPAVASPAPAGSEPPSSASAEAAAVPAPPQAVAVAAAAASDFGPPTAAVAASDFGPPAEAAPARTAIGTAIATATPAAGAAAVPAVTTLATPTTAAASGTTAATAGTTLATPTTTPATGTTLATPVTAPAAGTTLATPVTAPAAGTTLATPTTAAASGTTVATTGTALAATTIPTGTTAAANTTAVADSAPLAAAAAAAAPARPGPRATGADSARALAEPSPATAGATATPAIDAAPTASGATTTSVGVSDLPGSPHQRHAVGLGQAVDTIRLLIQAADQRGITRARIALRPQELGGVEVHLRHGADGLTARLIVDSAQSATLIQQAADDLRRSLEQQGISVAGLEVSLSGERDAAAGAGAERDERRDGPGAAGAAHRPHDGDDDPRVTTQTIELPGGALVDVLA